MQRPLIVVTNDDGITSLGLWAAAEALLPLGEVMVVAPDQQWSGAGRSMPHHVTGHLERCDREVAGERVCAYAVDASPALAVTHAITELAPRRPRLVVSGINYGANLGIEITISGTVGAALEAAACGVPALAVSLTMDPSYHLTGDPSADYGAAIAFCRKFAQQLLVCGLPYDVDALNLNVPADATPRTPWRMTRLSRRRWLKPVAPDRARGEGRPTYQQMTDPSTTGADSDVYAIYHDRIVSVTPISLDLTSRSLVEYPLWQMSVAALEQVYSGEPVA